MTEEWTPTPAQKAHILALAQAGSGYRVIASTIDPAGKLGITRHHIRRKLDRWKVEGAHGTLPKIFTTPINLVSHYDAARHALAIAKSLDEVVEIADKATAIKEYARRAKDRQLQIDATEIVIRAERRLGEMLIETKATTGLAPGGKPYQDKFTGPDLRPVNAPPTLEEIGIDKNLSSRAQKLAKVPQETMEARITDWRTTAERDGGRVSANILHGAPVNGARSIMGSRRELDDSLDYFPTPPWATRALCERVMPQLGLVGRCFDWVWEPACGEGHMSEVLKEYSTAVWATDIHDYGNENQARTCDFLSADDTKNINPPHWIITNPPFGEKTEQFVLRALDLAQEGVAIFTRLQWLETIGRYERLFRDRPPTLIAFFCERVNLCKGRWEPKGGTATAYIWLVWMKARAPLPPFWIPPGCREELTRPDDAERFTAHPVKSSTPAETAVMHGEAAE